MLPTKQALKRRKRRRRRPWPRRPPLTTAQILAWADAHHRRTGRWPTRETGPIADAPGETWAGVKIALERGRRELPRGVTLSRLLEERRGYRNRGNLPPLSEDQILGWADAYHQREGHW